MRKNKWLYACLIAMAFGMSTLFTVACSDKDKEPEEGEVVVTPEPEVEYYILGTVTEAGKGVANVDVKVNSETVKTNAEGKFSFTEKAKGSYTVEVAPTGYLSQKTIIEIAANAENRSVLTVALALTKKSEPVKVTGNEEITVVDNSESNRNMAKPGETDPDKVAENALITKAEVVIPASALPVSGVGINEDGSANVSVTTFVPAIEKVSTQVPATEENKEVAKSIPFVAANFEPSGLVFAKPTTMAIANPIPGTSFEMKDIQLTYLNPATGSWEKEQGKVVYNEKTDKYEAAIYHFSSYAIESAVTSKVSGISIVKDEILGQGSYDNTKNPKAVTGIVLKYTEKAGWDYEGSVTEVVKAALPGASSITVNAMATYLKTRMFAVIGSLSGVTSTERIYNTVNVNGYTQMDYKCYVKVRTTSVSASVLYKLKPVTITITAKRYTGTDHQYKTVTYNPGHDGGQGSTN